MGRISVMVAMLMLSPDSHFAMVDVATYLTVILGVIALIVWIVRIARFQTTLKVKQDEHKEQIDEKFRAVHKRIDDKADNSKLSSIDTKLNLILENVMK